MVITMLFGSSTMMVSSKCYSHDKVASHAPFGKMSELSLA